MYAIFSVKDKYADHASSSDSEESSSESEDDEAEVISRIMKLIL